MTKSADTMSRREVATYLGVHYNTVRGYEERDLLAPIRVMAGGIEEIHYLRSEVMAVAASGVVPIYRRGNPRPPQGNGEARALQAAERQNAELQAEIRSLQRLADQLQAMLDAQTAHEKELLTTIRDMARGTR